MKKMKRTKKNACILAVVFFLAACGQKEKSDTAQTSPTAKASTETIIETSEAKQTATSPIQSSDDSRETEETDKPTEKIKEIEETPESKPEAKTAESKTAKPEESLSEQSSEETEQKQQTEALAESDKEKNIQEIYQEITQSVSLYSPMIVPDNFIFNYYGIDVSTLEDYVFSMSEEATSAETIVILKVKDGESTESLCASLQTVIDQKKAEMENYLPEQFQIVDKSSVQVKGNYVYLVISEHADAISQMIQDEIE